MSTFIVECPPETWVGLGFDQLGATQSLAVLESIFATHLDGQPLIDQVPDLNTARWLNFKGITNGRWHHENVVLMGDAAHTTHFAIGAGTRLAILDAISLAHQLRSHRDLPDALQATSTSGEARWPLWRAWLTTVGSGLRRSIGTRTRTRCGSPTRCGLAAADIRAGDTICTWLSSTRR